jgi:hypothetical protein
MIGQGGLSRRLDGYLRLSDRRKVLYIFWSYLYCKNMNDSLFTRLGHNNKIM